MERVEKMKMLMKTRKMTMKTKARRVKRVGLLHPLSK